MVLCAAPLLVATSAVVRRTGGQGLGAPLARYLGLHGTAARDFTALFAGSSRVSLTELMTGLILGVVFGTGIAATLQRGWELLWSLPRASLHHLWRYFAWMAGLGLYVLIGLSVGQLGHHTDWSLHLSVAVRAAVELGASVAFYLWSQHLLLVGRISWRRLLPGAAAMGVGTTLLLPVSSWILPGQLVGQVNDYGPVGETFVLSLWLLTLSGLIIVGALVGVVVAERRLPAASHETTLGPDPLP